MSGKGTRTIKTHHIWIRMMTEGIYTIEAKTENEAFNAAENLMKSQMYFGGRNIKEPEVMDRHLDPLNGEGGIGPFNAKEVLEAAKKGISCVSHIHQRHSVKMEE